ncbi:NlpC/P60 family protein [Bacteroides sp. 224]|uniref:C40 family peptidase n=1 Tax=Bacteroides sp. 224 TaxID=2302936 RepID=UPI0013D1A289|nr:NlpC/P60 family protein [Bacteroides sp. 224]NDV65132.1 peptidase [Bacteroides sp. 224]
MRILFLPLLFVFFFVSSCANSEKASADTDGNTPEELIDTYGVVNLSVCNIHAKSDFSSEMITQAILGMPVRVLQHQKWYRIQTPDDYLGWVHRVGITLMNKEEYNAWNRAEKVVVTSHFGFTYEKPDMNSQSISDVVAGNRLKYEGTEQEFYKISYPDGKIAYIPQSIAKPEGLWRASIRQDAESIIRTSRTLLGVPYLWAGTSSKGMDCSGFVRTVLYMHDIIMPRDASQQAYVGEHIDIASDYSNLRLGDLIFFGRKATPEKKERVVHVGIYIGNKKFIHSQGDVRINSFDPTDSDYDEFNLNRLLFATRFLDSVDKTPAINTTLTNPYYLPQ